NLYNKLELFIIGLDSPSGGPVGPRDGGWPWSGVSPAGESSRMTRRNSVTSVTVAMTRRRLRVGPRREGGDGAHASREARPTGAGRGAFGSRGRSPVHCGNIVDFQGGSCRDERTQVRRSDARLRIRGA